MKFPQRKQARGKQNSYRDLSRRVTDSYFLKDNQYL